MALKQLPCSQLAAMDFQLDARSPKTPPSEVSGCHVQDPVGFEPLGDVVVACDGHEAAWQMATADSFGDRGGADFGDVAIDDVGELVEGDEGGRGAGKWGLGKTRRTPVRAGGCQAFR